MPIQLPAEADLSPLLSAARDQGSRGTCTAFATTALHEAAKRGATGAHLRLSEEVLYWGAKQADKNYIPGTSFRSAHLALGKWGQPEAALWPYDPARRDDDASYAPPPESIAPANCHFAAMDPVPRDVMAVKTLLAAGQAVAISVEMSVGFFRAPGGVVPIPQPHEMIADSHAILLTGYSDAGSTFRFRNSWGTTWGAGGYGDLPYDYFVRHGKSAYSLRLKA